MLGGALSGMMEPALHNEIGGILTKCGHCCTRSYRLVNIDEKKSQLFTRLLGDENLAPIKFTLGPIRATNGILR